MGDQQRGHGVTSVGDRPADPKQRITQCMLVLHFKHLCVSSSVHSHLHICWSLSPRLDGEICPRNCSMGNIVCGSRQQLIRMRYPARRAHVPVGMRYNHSAGCDERTPNSHAPSVLVGKAPFLRRRLAAAPIQSGSETRRKVRVCSTPSAAKG